MFVIDLQEQELRLLEEIRALGEDDIDEGDEESSDGVFDAVEEGDDDDGDVGGDGGGLVVEEKHALPASRSCSTHPQASE